MSRWTKEFDNHPIHGTLDRFELLSRNLSIGGLSKESLVEYRRFMKVIDQIRNIIKQVDPETLSPLDIDRISNELLNGGSLVNFTNFSNGDEPSIAAANDYLTANVIPHVVNLQAMAKTSKNEVPLRSLEKVVDEFTSNIAVKKETIDSQLTGLQKQCADMKSALDQLSDSIKQKQNEQTYVIAEFREAFTTSQSDRTEKHSDWLNNHQKENDDKARKQLEEANSFIEETKQSTLEETNKIKGEAEEIHKKILELYELAAGDSVGGGYAQTAKGERNGAIFWNFMVLVFIGAAIYFGWKASGTEIKDWIILAQNMPLTIICLFGAVLSSRRAKMHHTNEHAARWLSLEVRAVDPFIQSLSPEKQAEFKTKIGEKLFGQQTKQASSLNKEIIEDSIFAIFGREAFKFFKKGNGGD